MEMCFDVCYNLLGYSYVGYINSVVVNYFTLWDAGVKDIASLSGHLDPVDPVVSVAWQPAMIL